MICRSIRNQLSSHLDGRLSGAAARRVEAHLAECGRCQMELAELRAMKARLTGAARPLAPPGYWDALRAGLRERVACREQCPGPRWLALIWRRGPLMAAGTAMLLLIAIVPIQYFEQSGARSGVSLDEMVARHAGYCARQPLLEHGRMHYLVAEAAIPPVE